MADKIATEVRLFTFGKNETEKGTFVLSKADAAACLTAWKARGTDLSWDYEHAVTKDSTGPCPAAAWCSLEVRGDGLWATNIRWTSTALKLLEAKEYRYFSPFFEHTEAGHILNVINIALTNIPATHGIAPLVAASALASRRGTRGRAQPIPRGRLALSTRNTRTMNEEEKKAMRASLAEMQDKCKAMEAKLAEGDDAPPPPPHDEPDGDEGDKKDATSAAAALCALTGEKNPLAALAKLVERQAAGDDGGAPSVAQRVALAVSEGKLPPVLRATAETWTGEQLAAYLAVAKGVPVKGPTGGGTGARQGASGAATTLSTAEREVAKRLGITEAAFLASKNNLNARKGA